jgi:hypothetical protein
MQVEVQHVPQGRILEALSCLRQYLQDSVAWTGGRVEEDDLARLALAPQSQLWIVIDTLTGVIHGYLLTEIKAYPRKPMFVVHHCAMRPHTKALVEEQMHKTMEQFARDQGCWGVEFFGRPGWKRHAKAFGYSTQTVVYEKHFYG